jgi:hypothetical protein
VEDVVLLTESRAPGHGKALKLKDGVQYGKDHWVPLAEKVGVIEVMSAGSVAVQ